MTASEQLVAGLKEVVRRTVTAVGILLACALVGAVAAVAIMVILAGPK